MYFYKIIYENKECLNYNQDNEEKLEDTFPFINDIEENTKITLNINSSNDKANNGTENIENIINKNYLNCERTGESKCIHIDQKNLKHKERNYINEDGFDCVTKEK